jgi:hypothetical protein
MGVEEGEEVQAKNIQQYNRRKFPKSWERVIHLFTGNLQDTKLA